MGLQDGQQGGICSGSYVWQTMKAERLSFWRQPSGSEARAVHRLLWLLKVVDGASGGGGGGGGVRRWCVTQLHPRRPKPVGRVASIVEAIHCTSPAAGGGIPASLAAGTDHRISLYAEVSGQYSLLQSF